MKKIFVLRTLTGALCLAAALTACFDSILPDVDTSEHSGYIRFAFAGEPGISLTRTEGVGEENGADTDSIGIYLFDQNNNFFQAWYRCYTDNDSIDNGQRIYQMRVENFPGRTARMVVLRVPQNGRMLKFRKGDRNSTLDDFKLCAIDFLEDGERLVPPFVMSNKAVGGQPYIETELSYFSPTLTVTMKRRVARIDLRIVNEAYPPEQVAIRSVTVTNVQRSGRLLDIDDVYDERDGFTVTYTPEQLANTDGENPYNSIYLYPTEMGPGEYETGIEVEMTVNGKIRMFDLTPVVKREILANSCYNMPVVVNPESGDFAYSNIYWDGTKLTFDTTPSADPTRQKQGVLFRWGSLIGISPAGEWDNSTTKLYIPDVGDRTWSVGYGDTNPWEGTGWTDIPYNRINYDSDPEGYDPLDCNRLFDIGDYSGFTGDICKYLSRTGAVSGRWRMPTINDYTRGVQYQRRNHTYEEANTIADGAGMPDFWSKWGDPTWTDITAGGTADDGTQVLDRGLLINGTDYLPLPGARLSTNGQVYDLGVSGNHWTGSAYAGASNGICLFYNERHIDILHPPSRTFALSVRCVRE